MCEGRLPHTQLELVHLIGYKHPVKVESVFKQAVREGILKQCDYLMRVRDLTVILTLIGTSDVGPSTFSIAFDPTRSPI